MPKDLRRLSVRRIFRPPIELIATFCGTAEPFGSEKHKACLTGRGLEFLRAHQANQILRQEFHKSILARVGRSKDGNSLAFR